MMNFWIDRGGKVISQNLARIEPPHFEISRTRELRVENKNKIKILNFLARIWLVLDRFCRFDLVLKSPLANRITQEERKLKINILNSSVPATSKSHKISR